MEAPGSGTVFRALRADAGFPFISVGGTGDEYEVVREEGDVDGSEGVTFFNAFEVPAGSDEAFLAWWDAVPLTGRQGFLGRRMHFCDGARFRYVNRGRWSSPLMFQRATRLPEVATAMEALAFPSHPGLYLPQ